MEIKEIKAALSIETVLQHYGLKPDKNDRLLCPIWRSCVALALASRPVPNRYLI